MATYFSSSIMNITLVFFMKKISIYIQIQKPRKKYLLSFKI